MEIDPGKKTMRRNNDHVDTPNWHLPRIVSSMNATSSSNIMDQQNPILMTTSNQQLFSSKQSSFLPCVTELPNKHVRDTNKKILLQSPSTPDKEIVVSSKRGAPAKFEPGNAPKKSRKNNNYNLGGNRTKLEKVDIEMMHPMMEEAKTHMQEQQVSCTISSIFIDETSSRREDMDADNESRMMMANDFHLEPLMPRRLF